MSTLLGLLGVSTITLLVIGAVVIGLGLFTWVAWASFVKTHWKVIAVIGAAIVLGGGGYLTGYYRADAKCDTATLLLKIKQLERDLTVQREADKIEDAEMEILEKQKADADAEIAAYEKLLKEHPHTGDDCTINQEDIDRLINHDKGKKP